MFRLKKSLQMYSNEQHGFYAEQVPFEKTLQMSAVNEIVFCAEQVPFEKTLLMYNNEQYGFMRNKFRAT